MALLILLGDGRGAFSYDRYHVIVIPYMQDFYGFVLRIVDMYGAV